MSALLQRAIVLTIARSFSFAVLLLSPILLVRLLDMETYGQYREFMLYAMGAISLLGFGIPPSLGFFLPLHAKKHQVVVTQTVLLLGVSSAVGCALLILSEPWVLAGASFEFLPLLMAWVVFYLNPDILEGYWIGTRRSGYVLAYTACRSLARLVVVVTTAAVTGNIYHILTAMVALEVLKALAITAGLGAGGLLRRGWDKEILREQLRYILPLGAAGVLIFANQRLGQFVVLAEAGTAALAIYTIGTYQLPVMTVVRSAVTDALFPDMVSEVSQGKSRGLRLWRRATVLYCSVIFPIVALLAVHADLFIRTLFTDAYREAAAVFQVSLIFVLRQCFDMGLPLRATNANRFVLWGNIGALFVQLPLLLVLLEFYGLVGAAGAWVLTDLLMTLYFARRIMGLYGVSFAQFLPWPEIGRIGLVAAALVPIASAPTFLGSSNAALVLASSGMYLGLYLAIVWRLRIPEMTMLLALASERFRQWFRHSKEK